MYHVGDKNVLEHRDLTELKSLEIEDTADGQVAHMAWKLDPAKHYSTGPDGQHERPFLVRSTDGIEHKMHPVPARDGLDPFHKMDEVAVEEAAAEEASAEVEGPSHESATEGILSTSKDAFLGTTEPEAPAPEPSHAPPTVRLSRAPKTINLVGEVPQEFTVGDVTVVPSPRPE